MGAMENKGLNVFNTKYVLADADTATDGDFDGIEGVIAHEYFHNWSGNRVTCRDWFQLSLEGRLHRAARPAVQRRTWAATPVKRIEDVRVLRAAQFPEDSGPLAHPIRPDSYREITNFYTATVYNKGAEVIRMMRTMAGEERFRKGTDLYFERHDGEAATCEDFVKAIEDGAGLDLEQFRRWYSAGRHAARSPSSWSTRATPRRCTSTGQCRPPPASPTSSRCRSRSSSRCSTAQPAAHRASSWSCSTEAEQSFTFAGFAEPPVLSINRGFSAPVVDRARASRARTSCSLPRTTTIPSPATRRCRSWSSAISSQAVDGDAVRRGARAGRAAIGAAFRAVLADDALDDLMRGELLMLPSETYLAEADAGRRPGAIHAEREGLKAWHRAATLEERSGSAARARQPPCLTAAIAEARGRAQGEDAGAGLPRRRQSRRGPRQLAARAI